MDSIKLKAAMDAAYEAWCVNPNKRNLKELESAQREWARAGCNVQASSADGGGTGNGPPAAP